MNIIQKNLKDATENVVHWLELLQDIDLAKLLLCRSALQESYLRHNQNAVPKGNLIQRFKFCSTFLIS